MLSPFHEDGRGIYHRCFRLGNYPFVTGSRPDTGMPENPLVKILQRPRGWIRVSPSERTLDPRHLTQLKAEILPRWPLTSLLDVLNETD